MHQPSSLLNCITGLLWESGKLFQKDSDGTFFFVTPLPVVIQFLPLGVMGNPLYLADFVQDHMEVFLDVRAAKDEVISSGIAIF